MQYSNENTTDYLVRFRNAQKVNESCDGSLITKGVQKHGIKIIFSLNNNGFDSLQKDEKKGTEKEGEEMLCAILYLENSYKAGFDNLKKRVENDYVLNKAEHPRTVIAAHILILNYQTNYNSNRNSQSNGVSNHLMFENAGKLGTMKATEKRRSRDPG